MARSRKIKVVRKLTDTQLQFSNTVSGVNTVTSGVGIASTSISSDTCFILTGKRNLSDQIDAFVAVSGNASCAGCPGSTIHQSGEGQHWHGGSGCAGSGANFIAANVSNIDSGSWCICQVGLGCTASIFCKLADTCNNFMMANRGNNGHDGQPAFGCHISQGEHSRHFRSNGSPGCTGVTTTLAGYTYATNAMYRNVCCVQGCPGSGCPLGDACGGSSGYQNSIYCSSCIVTSGFATASTGNARIDSICTGRGWVHVSTPGRKENRL